MGARRQARRDGLPIAPARSMSHVAPSNAGVSDDAAPPNCPGRLGLAMLGRLRIGAFGPVGGSAAGERPTGSHSAPCGGWELRTEKSRILVETFTHPADPCSHSPRSMWANSLTLDRWTKFCPKSGRKCLLSAIGTRVSRETAQALVAERLFPTQKAQCVKCTLARYEYGAKARIVRVTTRTPSDQALGCTERACTAPGTVAESGCFTWNAGHLVDTTCWTNPNTNYATAKIWGQMARRGRMSTRIRWVGGVHHGPMFHVERCTTFGACG